MDITERGTTTAPPEVVWGVLADIDRWPAWLPTVTAVERTDDASETGVGSTFAVTQPRLGRAEWRVTRWEPGRGFTWASRRPGVLTTGTHDLRPRDGGTDIELGIGWTGPAAWLARLAFGRMTRGYVARELAALVRTAEERAASS